MVISDDVKNIINDATTVTSLAGDLEVVNMDGMECSVRTYEDPWGVGLQVVSGEIKNTERKRVNVINLNEGRDLFDAHIDGDDIKVIVYDRTTIWDLVLATCVDEVKKNYSE